MSTWKSIGRFSIGTNVLTVQVCATEGGGWFDNDNIGIGLLGTGDGSWRTVINILIHEAVEYAAAQMGLRFRQCFDVAQASNGFIFIMNHSQYSEAVARAAILITEVLPVLATHYNKRRRK